MASQLRRILLLLIGMTLSVSFAQINANFDVHVAELNGIRMISTSDFNYAVTDPEFAQNWRTISVNGDDLIIATQDNNIINKTLSSLTEDERNELKRTKSKLGEAIYFNGFGGLINGAASFSSTDGNNRAKYTTYSSSGSHMSSSSSMTSGGSNNNQMSHYSMNDISFSLNGDNDFAIYKKSNLPLNWSRVFLNGDLLTTVTQDGKILMRPLSVASPEEIKQLELLKAEIKSISQQQQQQFGNTMQNTMNMMNNIMGNMLGHFNPILATGGSQANRLPALSTGGIFGNNFPFGPNNSPFSNGFPFNNNFPFGAGAFAAAGRRK